MKTALTLISIAFCLSAGASPISNFLTVRYEGTVSKIGGTGFDRSIGDHVSGTLLIDVSRAPPAQQDGGLTRIRSLRTSATRGS